MRIVAVIISGGEDNAEALNASIESICSAMGETPPIYAGFVASPSCKMLPIEASTGVKAMMSHFGREHGGSWLIPMLAGDRLSLEFGDILRRIAPHALERPLVYWDEDTWCVSGRRDPWIKPDWDELLFGRLGGLAGASILSLAAASNIAESMSEEPLTRECIDRFLVDAGSHGVRTRPLHIPLVLTHRDERHALQRNLSHIDCSRATLAKACSTPNWPSVSILVPTRDRPDLLAACLQGIERTSYPGTLELIVIDNGTVDKEALAILHSVANKPSCRVVRDDGEFNFSRLNNSAALLARGQFLCFLNNDVEPLQDDWLTILVGYAMRENAGAVGAQLLYPSGRLQHAGVAVGIGGAAGHVQKGVNPRDERFWTWHSVPRVVSAVTAAAMVLEKRKFQAVGGFDEVAFPVAFNDVDLCLRLKNAGLNNIYAADACLLHHESESRGDDQSPANAARYASEVERLQRRWQTEELIDSHFSPLFSRVVERCVLAP